MKIKTNRQTPLSGLTVYPTVRVDLDPEIVDRVFYHRLAELTEGLWIKTRGTSGEHDEVWQTTDMQGRGSDIDEKKGMATDPKFALPVAALRLKRALLDAAV